MHLLEEQPTISKGDTMHPNLTRLISQVCEIAHDHDAAFIAEVYTDPSGLDVMTLTITSPSRESSR